jgi:3-dehydroquinate dehydratase/shikimate dehydrogenase
MTQICVPIMVEEHASAIRDATLAAEHGADLVEFRVDVFFEDKEDSTDLLQDRIDRVLELVRASPLPCIVTCRPHWEGGEYHGDDDERISMYEALGTSDHPPAYIDVELATYTRSANIKQKVNLAVDHPRQQRSVSTRLILSTHDFEGRPSDLTRKILQMQDEPACAVVKVAYRARSIRDNLELFEILRDRTKPTIALGMGEFGVMSRILAPKFGGFLTFASLRDESNTAPGQITIEEMIGLYRFRSIRSTTKVYGIIGWPVTQSMSPLVHNAGFEQIGWDGVYVPMPVEGSYESFKATVLSLIDHEELNFAGASVTIPHKLHLSQFGKENDFASNVVCRSMNTIAQVEREGLQWYYCNTDQYGVLGVLNDCETPIPRESSVAIVGAGGVADSTAELLAHFHDSLHIFNRTTSNAEAIAAPIRSKTYHRVDTLAPGKIERSENEHGIPTYMIDSPVEKTQERSVHVLISSLTGLPESNAQLYINCTPVGMTGGPDPDGLSIPIPDMPNLSPDTVFFDTVYNPIETPMLKAAKERGYRTIDGVQMFVKQAAAQFSLWTDHPAPEDLFDTLVRGKLGA